MSVDLKELDKKRRALNRKYKQLAGQAGPSSIAGSQAEIMRERRRLEQSIYVPDVADPDRRRACEADIFSFLKTYFSDSFYQPFTVKRAEIVTDILNAASQGGDQATAAPRGDGKTTIVECVTIYCLNLGLLKFPLICAATGPDATRILENIKRQYETNDLLAADYPEICIPIMKLERWASRALQQTVDGEFTLMTWGKDKVVFPTVPDKYGLPENAGSLAAGSVLMTRGLDSAIRGIRLGTVRPDLVIIDDPETRESAESDVQIERRSKTIEQDIGGLGGPGKAMSRLLLCTIMNRKCVAHTYTDRQQKPSWNGKRYRLIEEWPEREDLWDEYILLRQSGMAEGDTTAKEACEFYKNNREAMDAGAVVSNKYRYIEGVEASALEHCYRIIADRGREAFLTEYQNDPPEDAGPQESGINARLVQSRVNGVPKLIIPEDFSLLTAGVDIGKRAIHWTVLAWKTNATGAVIDYGVADVFPKDTADRQSVEIAISQSLHQLRDYWLSLPYMTADGEILPIKQVLVDSGNWTDAIYAFCAKTGQKMFRPSKGFGSSVDGRKSPFRAAKEGTSDNIPGQMCWLSRQRGNVWLVGMDTDFWKGWLHERLMTDMDKPASITLFGSERREHTAYAHHLVAEVETTEFVPEKGLKHYWKQKSPNNHWLDATYQACVAGSLHGIKLIAGASVAPVRRRQMNQPKNNLIQRPGGWLKGMQ
jgi:hypothetical protein